MREVNPKSLGKASPISARIGRRTTSGWFLTALWGWRRTRCQAEDAIAQDYDAGKTAVVGDREVRVWTKLERVGGGRGVSRHYPASEQRLPPSSEPRLVSTGWSHEHCDLCRAHIESREFGYSDPKGTWVCERCYERYVLQHDLAFVDELPR